MPRLPLALTMGDAAGIGPELAILAWRDRKLHGLSPFAIYADLDLMRSVASTVGTDLPIADDLRRRKSVGVFDQALPVVPVPLNQPARAGEPTPRKRRRDDPFDQARCRRCRGQTASAVVTNPIAKSVLYQAGFEHPGHTEYLGVLAEGILAGRAGPARDDALLIQAPRHTGDDPCSAEGRPCPADAAK